MLIARFLDGLSGSAFLSVAGGTVGDMFNRETLQLPMLIYTGSPFIGPVSTIFHVFAYPEEASPFQTSFYRVALRVTLLENP
jgi:MFS family permease